MIDSTFNMTFASGQFYESVDGVQRICEVKDVVYVAAAATNDQQVIAAVSGKKIFVLSGTLGSAGAAGAATFKSATAGTNKHGWYFPANPGIVEMIPQAWGVFNTNSGEGLFVDNTSVALLVISLRYIEVTPQP